MPEFKVCAVRMPKRSMNKERLVVIGNGMAGARFVDDLLARGGGDRFDVVMFGDEPCGNYNRILLSSVLSRSHKPDDIFINPMSWYTAKGITLHAGKRVEQSISRGNTSPQPADSRSGTTS